jgi:hypothetical protein
MILTLDDIDYKLAMGSSFCVARGQTYSLRNKANKTTATIIFAIAK